MMRLDYIPQKPRIPGTFWKRSKFMQIPLLTGKTILSVMKDGVGYTEIIIDRTVPPMLPTGKHVKFNPDLATLLFPDYFDIGEKLTVLYQDIP